MDLRRRAHRLFRADTVTCLQARISCEATVVFFLWTFVFLFLSDVATGTLLDLADGANAAQTHSGTMRTESDPVTVHNHTAENNNTVWVRHTAGRLLNLRGASSMGSGKTIAAKSWWRTHVFGFVHWRMFVIFSCRNWRTAWMKLSQGEQSCLRSSTLQLALIGGLLLWQQTGSVYRRAAADAHLKYRLLLPSY